VPANRQFLRIRRDPSIVALLFSRFVRPPNTVCHGAAVEHRGRCHRIGRSRRACSVRRSVTGCLIIFVILSSTAPAATQQAAGPGLLDRVNALEDRQRALEQQLELLAALLDSNSAAREAIDLELKAAGPIPLQPVVVSGLPTVGSTTARLALIEFSDFLCPYCRRYFNDTWPLIDREFIQTGKVLYVFHYLPLTALHPMAMRAATAAECASRQDRFWQMRDRLFAQPHEFARDDLLRHAAAVKLNPDEFIHCMDNSDSTSGIQHQVATANRLSISATPTFLLGVIDDDGRVRVMRRIAGAQSAAVFAAALEQIRREVR
jgi:protein-disulfide isomerase